MRPPRLVALCSPVMGSGKSEVAGRLLSAQFPDQPPFKLIKFAGPVKAMAFALFLPIVGAEEAERMVEGDLKEVFHTDFAASPRRIMQTLGTEWGRDTINQDLWVHLAMLQVKHWMDKGYSVVMDDLRFLNEYDAVRAMDGDCYRVVRPEAPNYLAHKSEGELDSITMKRIQNDGDLLALHHKADRIARGDF